MSQQIKFPRGAVFWTREQILDDVLTAKGAFRKRRFGEPMQNYVDAFERLEKANRQVIGSLTEIFKNPINTELITSLLKKDLLTALRYLAAPPISTDDLETLVGGSIAPKNATKDPDLAVSIRDTLKAILDPKRFPWIYEGRDPTERELEIAIIASTVPAAAQSVQTGRRSDEKAMVENAVNDLLERLDFKRIATKPIETLQDGPSAGEYMEETLVGEHKADKVVGLFDGRVMALECKASNSQINSRKRINKEVAIDAKSWVEEFGTRQLVPAAAIQGVYNPNYIISAQNTPVVFYWAHRLADLETFVNSTKRS